MLSTVDLAALGARISAPSGIVYSTDPRIGICPAGRRYFTKGPDEEIVFAELAGCLLAEQVGLPVAAVSVCVFGGEKHCGSHKVADLGRDVMPWLKTPELVTNFGDLYAAVVVDCWLANEDRNLGNVLATAQGKGKVSLVMIDFEKSRALRPSPTISSTMVDARNLWPRGDLGALAKAFKPMVPPAPILQRITAIADKPGAIDEILQAVTSAYKPVGWSADTVAALTHRGRHIGDIAEDVWRRA